MKNRKSFLAMLGMTGMTLGVAARGSAAPTDGSTAGPKAPAAPSASASASATPDVTPSSAASAAATGTSGATKPPSEAALATARTMRRFDPQLSDAEIETIARGIDENATAGARLNPKNKRLRNSDEPVTAFTVPLA